MSIRPIGRGEIIKVISILFAIIGLSLFINVQSVSAKDYSEQEDILLAAERRNSPSGSIRLSNADFFQINSRNTVEEKISSIQIDLAELEDIEADFQEQISDLDMLKQKIEERLKDATGEDKELLEYQIELIAEQHQGLDSQLQDLKEKKFELQKIVQHWVIEKQAKELEKEAKQHVKPPKDPKDKNKDTVKVKPEKDMKVKDPALKEPKEIKEPKELKEPKEPKEPKE